MAPPAFEVKGSELEISRNGLSLAALVFDDESEKSYLLCAGFAGAEGATGFTLVVPNRKSVSSAAGLGRKDKRIDSVNVVNFPDRCEITVHFKGDVPPYLAKAQDKTLLIEVGAGKGKAEASEDGDDGDDTKLASNKKHKKKGAKHEGASKKESAGHDAAKHEGGKKKAKSGAESAKADKGNKKTG